MNSTVRLSLIGAGVGAGLMFMLDPVRGGRRRTLARDKMARALRKTRNAASATRRDLGNRIGSITARTRTRTIQADVEADDRTISERVRAELGRVSSHPRAITVGVTGAWVTLSGDVLASEQASIVAAISSGRGLEGVKNNLAEHEDARGVRSLQAARTAQWPALIRSRWRPTAMVIVSAGTAALAAVAMSNRQ